MTLGWGSPVTAEPQALRYACSNQVYKSLGEDQAKAFSDASKSLVQLNRGSSSAVVSELLSGRTDVASSARELYVEEKDQGLREFPFCVSSIAVITKSGCGIAGVSKDQVTDLFSGAIGNWHELGGPDLPIAVVVPSEETAAHRNFRRLVTGSQTLYYDFLARDSTGVIDLVRSLPCGAVAFIGYGAVAQDSSINALEVSGLGPTDKDYPYSEVFRLVTLGEPRGIVLDFVEFAFSPTSRAIIESHGMFPLPPKAEGSK